MSTVKQLERFKQAVIWFEMESLNQVHMRETKQLNSAYFLQKFVKEAH
jgi:hypothetical protein